MIIEPISGGLYLITVPDLTRKKGKRLLDEKKMFFKQIKLKKKINGRQTYFWKKKFFFASNERNVSIGWKCVLFFRQKFQFFFCLQIQKFL